MLIFACIENYSFSSQSYSKDSYRAEIKELESVIDKNKCDFFYYSFGRSSVFFKEQLKAVTVSLSTNSKTLNGYSGMFPLRYKDFQFSMDLPEVMQWLALKKITKGKLLYITPKGKGFSSGITEASLVGVTGGFENLVYDYYLVDLPLNIMYSYNFDCSPIDQIRSQTSFSPNEEYYFPVIMKNKTNFIWNSQGVNPVTISYRLYGDKLIQYEGDGIRTLLHKEIRPNESFVVNVKVKMPPAPGIYDLTITPVHEGLAWFNDKCTVKKIKVLVK